MKKRFAQIVQYIDAHREDIFRDLKTIVDLESFTGEPENVHRVGEKLREMFADAGMDCELVETGGAPTLIGIQGKDRPGKPILFTGHMDTVFPEGSFGDEPFRLEDGKVYGPGCLDMKGGIIIALYVIKALNSIGYDETPLKIVFSGDEETAHDGSNGGEVFAAAVKGGLFAFNMETGYLNNALVLSRKGCLTCEVVITGTEAHAGNAFFEGRSAILEAVQKGVAFAALTDVEKGTTLNLGTIHGGTVPNCVAGSCTMELDCRFWTMADKERLEREITRIVEEHYVEGTTATVRFYGGFPPFEENPLTRKFFDYCCRTAEKFALEVPLSRSVGGSSDASLMFLQNVPVICSFGAQGEWNHTRREYVVAESLLSRSKLIAAAVLNQTEFADV